LAKQVFHDAALEGNSFTEPEVFSLLSGQPVAGRNIAELNQVLDLKEAATYVLDVTKDGPLPISQGLTDAIHERAARHDLQPSLLFRGDYHNQRTGPQVRLDLADRFQAPNAGEARALFEYGKAGISRVSHPVAMACLWAAYATYSQFYFDGNKRTARHTMNALLISRGFDSILVPNKLKSDYENVLVAAFKTADLTTQARFLAGQYQVQADTH